MRFQYDQFKALAQNPKVVAIGETGLDHFRLPSGREEEILKLQEKLFKQQIKLAGELNKPLIVHCRDNKNKPGETYERLYKILLDPVAEQALVRLQDLKEFYIIVHTSPLAYSYYPGNGQSTAYLTRRLV